jgi:uncharacterized membrane protein
MKKVQLPKRERVTHEIRLTARNLVIIGIAAYVNKLWIEQDIQFPIYVILLLAALIAIVYFFLAIVKINEDEQKQAKRTARASAMH